MNPTEKNKDLVTRYIAALNTRDLDAAAALTAEALVNHAAIPEAQGAAGMRSIVSKFLKAMPDLTWTCEDLIAEKDRVVARVRMRGTQTGPLETKLFAAPATGREVSTEHIHVFRIEGDKIVECWLGRDDFGMMRQLGHVPFATKVA